ncbi:MAG: hypothetical protein EKK61_04935 [Rickettsiales bacterium]|nr:MAG: hypothetical protein EKK61_04935 [Rickettsiales bacterium]
MTINNKYNTTNEHGWAAVSRQNANISNLTPHQLNQVLTHTQARVIDANANANFIQMVNQVLGKNDLQSSENTDITSDYSEMTGENSESS